MQERGNRSPLRRWILWVCTSTSHFQYFVFSVARIIPLPLKCSCVSSSMLSTLCSIIKFPSHLSTLNPALNSLHSWHSWKIFLTQKTLLTQIYSSSIRENIFNIQLSRKPDTGRELKSFEILQWHHLWIGQNINLVINHHLLFIIQIWYLASTMMIVRFWYYYRSQCLIVALLKHSTGRYIIEGEISSVWYLDTLVV